MAETNEKKRFGRRAGFGIAALALISVSYYVCLFRSVGLEWFKDYSLIIIGITGFIVSGLTITDSILKK